MALKDVAIPRRTVDLSVSGDVQLRGLTLTDIMSVYRHHGGQLGIVFTTLMDKNQTLSDSTLQAAIRELAMSAPEALAEIICLAADEPDMHDTAVRLPLLDQASILEAIFELTLTSEADLKKLVETVLRALNGFNRTAAQVELANS